MKIIIIGGVAGGATAAARLRRQNEEADIILVERGEDISYANCGLPYYVGGVISERDRLFVQTPESIFQRFRIDVRTRSEAVRLDLKNRCVEIPDLRSGIYQALSRDAQTAAVGEAKSARVGDN